MGKRGPRPAPTQLKLLKGTRADRINDDEPAPRPSAPIKDKWLSDDVSEVWDRVVGELEAMDLAFASDSDVIRCYCEAVVQHARASDLLATTGVLVEGALGGQVRNPALQIQRDQAQLIRSFAQELGLTPAARTSIRGKEAGSGAGTHENPFADTGG
jgi:P27 family predicted phage terminase small subunit